MGNVYPSKAVSLDAAAHHEAGHAVMMYHFGLIPNSVCIHDDGTGSTAYNMRGDRSIGDVAGWSFNSLTLRRINRQRMAEFGPATAAAYEEHLMRLFEAEIRISLAGGRVEKRYRK